MRAEYMSTVGNEKVTRVPYCSQATRCSYMGILMVHIRIYPIHTSILFTYHDLRPCNLPLCHSGNRPMETGEEIETLAASRTETMAGHWKSPSDA